MAAPIFTHSDMVEPALHREFFNLCMDDLLGEGSARKVWSSKMLPGVVIKVEEGSGSFQNILEWEAWKRVKGTPAAKWFAPCLHISPNGSILIMARTERPSKAQYPKRLPAFLSDTKFDNYGMLDGRFVCHDYGVNLLMEHGAQVGLQAAHWWD